MNKLTLVAVIVITAAETVACGTQPRGPAPVPKNSVTAGRTASTPPPAPARPTLTEADNGATIRLSPGQPVTVVLSSRGMFSWHIPAAADTVVRRASAAGGYPAHQPARATFIATRRGTATLSAVNDAACLHGRPACTVAQRTWRVTIIVSQ